MLRESADRAEESSLRLAGKFRKENSSKGNLPTEGHREESDAGKETAAHKDAAWKETAREELTRDIVETHEKMLGTFIKRSQQVDRIIGHINETPHRTIICGDFNDTPMSYTYHTLAKNRKDTFKEAGKGFGATFVPMWPLLRIDYLLVPEDSQCITHTIHRSGLSDHYPVSAEIII
jgi:endonuclease/exonuclease/phosphatase family metal-dependent hydrolase